MRKVFCLSVCISLSNTVLSQHLTNQTAADKLGIFSHLALGFEIGSNFLDIEKLNSELTNLGLLSLDPYTNNFAFQVGIGLNRIEAYTSLMLLATSAFTDTIGTDHLFLSSSLNGTYVGVGVRGNIISLFNERLSLMASLDLSTAYYFLRVSKATITNRNILPLLDSSQAIMANSGNQTLQPAMELLYAIMKKKNRFDIGLKVGYIYHLQENIWENQHGVGIIGLSPIRNNESYNVALKMVYTFTRCDCSLNNY